MKDEQPASLEDIRRQLYIVRYMGYEAATIRVSSATLESLHAELPNQLADVSARIETLYGVPLLVERILKGKEIFIEHIPMR